MRVKVSYSIDLDDVPQELLKLGKKVSDLVKKDMTHAVDDLKESLVQENHLKTADHIIDLKKVLINLDQTVADLGNMLGGYNGVRVNSQIAEGSGEIVRDIDSET